MLETAASIVALSNSSKRGLIQSMAALGTNIRHMGHRHGELHLPVYMTEVILQMETRDYEHQRELLQHFASEGLSFHNPLGL